MSTDDRGLSSYLHDLRRHAPLDRDAEHRLALEYRRTGSPRLAHQLVCGHLRLVVKIAQEYRWSGHDLLDLIEEGNLGLLTAVEKYDPDRGVRLSSYAAWWIRAGMMHFIAGNRRLVRIGTTAEQRKVMARLSKARKELAGSGASEDVEALARLMDVRPEGLEALAAHVESGEVALDGPAANHEHGTRLDGLAADAAARPDALVEQADELAHARRATRDFMETLGERDRRLLRQRWLVDEQPTLQEMGNRFGVTRERARQLENRVLDRLRSFAVAGAR